MKKTTKKRALVSSVAMLAVSAVAMGSATYAWFTQNTQATADQLSVKTVKASELQLAAATGEWTDHLHYGYTGKVLKPASSADGKNWFAATAADKASSAADTDTIEKLSTLDGYVYKNQLNVRNNGGAAVNDVQITFNLTETEAANGKYLRLALVPVTARGADVDPTASDFKANVYGSAADSAAALTSTAGATDTVTAKSGASATFNVGNLTAKDTAGAVKYYNLYVWFEGQDTDCKDANAGNDMPEITFTVSGDTAATTA